MADPWIDIPIVTDKTVLADNAIEGLRGTWTDWEPNDGDPEVVLIEELADMAADAATQAAQMPSEAMIALGALLNVPFNFGTPAEAHLTLTAIDAAGYRVPGGEFVNVDGYTFILAADAIIAPGDTSLSGVIAFADHNGVDANELPGTIVASLSLPAFIVNVSLDTPTSGGADDEDFGAYRNRMARDRRLASRTLINKADAEAVALDTPGIGRAIAISDSARHVTVTVTDPSGDVASDPAKAALLATYQDLLGDRLVNTTYAVGDAEYTVVNVDWTADAAPGVDASSLEAAVNSSLASLLTALVWGTPSLRSAHNWINTPVVAKNDIIALIGSTPGVQRVTGVTLSSPTVGASVSGAGDLTMAGSVPLPTAGTMTGVVS